MSALGKLSMEEIHKLSDHEFDSCPACMEFAERDRAMTLGAPSRHALLSVAQIVETLWPLIHHVDEECGIPSDWNDAIHACARAFLNRAPGEPSGLELEE